MAFRRVSFWAQVLFRFTVDSLLTDTSIRRTLLYNGHLELVPAFLYSLYLTFCKTNISASAGPRGVRLGENWLYLHDFAGNVSTVELHLYADDTTAFAIGDTIEFLNDYEIFFTLKSVTLTIHPKKCEAISRKQFYRSFTTSAVVEPSL